MADEHEEALVRDINHLGFEVYRRLIADGTHQNIVFSPFSIALLVGLVESGADGQTRDQTRQLFDSVDQVKDVSALLGELRSHVLQMQGNRGELRIANGLFCTKEAPPREEFLQNAKATVDFQAVAVPFRQTPEVARQQVNQWVSNATNGKVPQTFNAFRADTSSILVNACWMNLAWSKPFEKRESKKHSFYRLSGIEQQVPFMYQTARGVQFIETEDLQLLELPYSWADFSMYIVLPLQRDGIEAIEHMTADELIRLLHRTEEASVHVYIPRFAVQSRLDVKRLLEQLGLTNWNCLSRMWNVRGMEIKEVVQQSLIRVKEKGTGIPGAKVPVPNEPPAIPPNPMEYRYFIAEHPFMFAVVYKPAWLIVFLGKVESVEDRE